MSTETVDTARAEANARIRQELIRDMHNVPQVIPTTYDRDDSGWYAERRKPVWDEPKYPWSKVRWSRCRTVGRYATLKECQIAVFFCEAQWGDWS